MPVELGVFDHLDCKEGPLDRIYEERLRLLEAYDAAGFRAYHLAEHHATPLGLAPSPSLFLAAAAQRTRRIRLGPLVYTVPLYEPLRLIEEVCMLDQMSGGRLELGVGRGIVAYELAYYGINHLDSPALFREALAILLKGLTSPVLSHRGERWRYTDVPMVLRPVQQPHPPLWYGLGNAASVPWCVEHAVNCVANAPAAAARTLFDAYRTEWQDAKGSASEPKLGISRHLFVAETEADAERVAGPAYAAWYASLAKLWMDFGAVPFRFAPDLEEARRRGVAIVGTPATVRAELERQVEASGANYLLCRFAFGSLSYEQAAGSLDLFVREVMPAFSPKADA